MRHRSEDNETHIIWTSLHCQVLRLQCVVVGPLNCQRIEKKCNAGNMAKNFCGKHVLCLKIVTRDNGHTKVQHEIF
jgi:hypothetical protein